MPIGNAHAKLPMSSDLSQKISWFSFVGMCMVVAIHLPRINIRGFQFFVEHFFYDGVCHVAVPFFFTVSGYMLSRHMSECGWWRREMRKRFRSLVVPFLMWCVMSELLRLAWRAIPILLAGMRLWFTGLAIGLNVLPSSRLYFFFRYACSFFSLFYFLIGILLHVHGKDALDKKWKVVGGCILLFFGGGIVFVRSMLVAWQFDAGYRILFFMKQISIPLMLSGAWLLLPPLKLPSCLKGKSFPIFLIHWSLLPPMISLLNQASPGLVLSVGGFVILGALFILSCVLIDTVMRRFIPKFWSLAIGGR